MVQPPSSSSLPSWRKGVGIALILLLILLWGGAIMLFAPYIGRWPILVQALFYLVVGIAWVIPLKPLLRWTETGAFRGTSRDPAG
jgi:predicted membrane channel-forming protein YqfA (hemolysin III family)